MTARETLEIVITVADNSKRALRGATANIQKVGTVTLGVAGAGLAAMGAGLVAVGTAAFNMSQEVEAATGNLQSQIGVTAEEAQALGDLAVEVWENNFAGSVTEAANAVGLVRQQLGDLADVELQDATENAFRMADAFGVEVNEGIASASVLMEEFGLTQQEAFDFMAKGFQDGLNASDDFLDSVNEYANLFADSGASADEFFSIMETGAAGGVLGTDKIADAFKEFQIIMNEGGDDARDVLENMGMDYDALAEQVGAGTADWIDFFDEIVGGLNDIEDPILRSQAQVELFGTMAEDLGVSFTEGLSAASTSLEDMEGSIDKVDAQYNTFATSLEGLRRTAISAFQPLGDAMLQLANQVMPFVQLAFEDLSAFISGFTANIEGGMSIWDAAIDAFLTWTQAGEGVGESFFTILDTVESLKAQMEEFIQPIIDFILQWVSMKDVMIALGIAVASVVIPAIISIAATLAPVIAAVAGLIAIVSLVRNAWENDWGGMQTKLTEFWETTAKPALEQLWTWLSETIPVVLEELKNTWENVLLPAMTNVWEWMNTTLFPFLQDTLIPIIRDGIMFYIDAMATLWLDVLLPAMSAIWEFLTNDMMPVWEALGDLIGVAMPILWEIFVVSLEDFFTQANKIYEFVRDNLGPIFEWLKDNVLDPVIESFGGLGEIIDNVAGSISNMRDQLANVDLPDWMTPGSPTPWEIGLRGVNSAMSQLNGVALPALTSQLTDTGASVVQNTTNNSMIWNITTSQINTDSETRAGLAFAGGI